MMKEIQQIIIAILFLFTTMVSAQEPSLNLKGKVYDKESKMGIGKASVHLIDVKGIVLKTATTDLHGGYDIQIKTSSDKFKVEAKAENFNQAEVLIDNGKENVEINFGLNKKASVVDIMSFPMIYFDFDSSYLTPQAKKELERVTEYMNHNPNVRLRLKAHTDSRGTSKYNDWLSSRRAERVRNWLIKEGKIDSNRIEEHHFGKTQLSNQCSDGVRCTAEQHRENRRCSLEIID